MSRIGRPPRDREGENARAEAALEQWLQGRAPLFTRLTPAEREALRVLLGDSEAAVDTILSVADGGGQDSAGVRPSEPNRTKDPRS